MDRAELFTQQMRNLFTSVTNEDQTRSRARQRLDWSKLRKVAIDVLSADGLPKEIELPSLPEAVTEFLLKAAEPDFDIRVLSAIIERDAVLTLQLLKHVNCALYGLTKPIGSVRDAILRLGLTITRNHLIATGVRSATLALRAKVLNARNFWDESLQRAVFSRILATRLRLDPELAFIGGLVQDYMLPVLTNHFPNEYLGFLRTSSEAGRDLIEWEEETFGWNHASVGVYFASRWNFPDELICAINCHHLLPALLNRSDFESVQLIPVAMCSLLPDQLCQSTNGLRDLIRIDTGVDEFQLDNMLETVFEEHRQLSESESSIAGDLLLRVRALRRTMN